MFKKTLFLLLFIVLIANGFSQTIILSVVNGIRIYPVNHQLYPRDSNNESVVPIQGSITNHTLYDEIVLEIKEKHYGGSSFINSFSKPVLGNTFSFNQTINTGLIEYTFTIRLKKNGTTLFSEVIAKNVVCGDVYLVSGQSNAFASVAPYSSNMPQQTLDYGSPFSKSFGKIGNYNTSNNQWLNYNPNDNLWHPSTTEHNWVYEGYVGVWALKLQYLIQKEYGVPTCIINGSRGATDIQSHRSQSNSYDLSSLFGALNYRVTQANLKNKIKGIIWYQGESNSGTFPSSIYKTHLDGLISEWQSEWGTVGKIYIVQIHTDCGQNGYSRGIREEQRTYKTNSIHNNIEVLTANGIGDRPKEWNSNLVDRCHFDRNAYNNFADRVFNIMSRDFYCSDQLGGINSPNIQQAYYENNKLILEFDQLLTEFPQGLEKFFSLHLGASEFPLLSGGITFNNKVILNVNNNNYTSISYLKETDPVQNLNNNTYLPGVNWVMSWLKNPKGNAAFSFYKFPISSTSKIVIKNKSLNYRTLCGNVSGTIIDKNITTCVCNNNSICTYNNSNLDIRAENIISLKPGFKAYKNSYFRGRIVAYDCNSNTINKTKHNSVNKLQKENFISIFPNPNNGSFMLKIKDNLKPTTISIYNPLGKIIYNKTVIREENKINITGQPNGIYFVLVENDTMKVYEKIILN